MTNKVLISVCIAVFAIIFQSCSDRDYYDPTKLPGYVAPNPSGLDYSTSHNVRLDLNYDVANGVISTVDFYTEYPLTKTGSLRTDITPIARGINVAGSTELSRRIPSYVDKLYAYSPNLFVPLVSSAKITNGIASFQPEAISVEPANTTRAGNAGDLWKRASIYELKKREDFYAATSGGNFKYDIITPDYQSNIPAEVMTHIGNTFGEYERIPLTSEFVRDATFTVVKGSKNNESAKIYLSILSTGCDQRNSLSYFVYTGDKEFSELTKEETAKLEVITLLQLANSNNNYFSHMKIGITPGNYIQLLYKNENGQFVEDFPVGAKIGWRLNANGFDEANFTVKESEVRFSVPVWNDNKWGDQDYQGGTDSNYTIQFQTADNKGNIYKCFGFEDKRYNSDEDYNDLVFHVYSDPADGLSELPEVKPEDVTITESYKGILAFEDNWPKKGDYDLNDVVVKYQSDVTYIAKAGNTDDATAQKVVDTFSFVHTGATYRNAFSYKVNISPASISSITIFDENKNIQKDYTTQIIPDGDGFIIDLCPNVKGVIEAMTDGEVKVPQVYTVTMEFKDGAVKQNYFAKNCAPYNPFIAPIEKPGVEVHLPMYLPTKRAEKSYFGTEDDRSDGGTMWYVSGENIKFPFAIHLSDATSFRIPKEEYDISTTYPNYLKWVESGMTSYKDWYK